MTGVCTFLFTDIAVPPEAHLRKALGDASCESLERKGETWPTPP